MAGRSVLVALFTILNVCAAFAHADVRPVYTNQSRFRIPYKFDATELARLGAREIRLYGSVDKGTTWKQLQSVPPQPGKFEFRAAATGEYWFAVKTIDALGDAHPEGETQAGLIVIIDEQAPKLKLSLKSLGPNKVELTWTASDPNLDTSSLQLEYREGPGDRWKKVIVNPSATGKTNWNLVSSKPVEVRGQIADLAANVTKVEQTLNPNKRNELAPASIPTTIEPSERTRPYVPDFSQPIAEDPESDGKIVTAPLSMPKQYEVETPLASFPKPVDQQLPTPVSPLPDANITDQAVAPSFANTPTQPSISPGNLLQSPIANRPLQLPQITASNPKTATAPTISNHTSQLQIAGRKSLIKYVQRNQFEIAYKLDDIGPSGIREVELFMTQNNGQTWMPYGTDHDRRSPVSIRVTQGGTYGFAIRPVNGIGNARPAPRPGDAPDVTVVVDISPPRLTLDPIAQGTGGKMNTINFRWLMEDDHPSDKPIAIFYAAAPEGPWMAITDWMENQGQYTWTVNHQAPNRLYFRIAARDAAGNITYRQSLQPVVIDMSLPSATILDVGLPSDIDLR